MMVQVCFCINSHRRTHKYIYIISSIQRLTCTELYIKYPPLTPIKQVLSIGIADHLQRENTE